MGNQNSKVAKEIRVSIAENLAEITTLRAQVSAMTKAQADVSERQPLQDRLTVIGKDLKELQEKLAVAEE